MTAGNVASLISMLDVKGCLMGFFKRRGSANDTSRAQTPSIGLGSGRRLRSDLQATDCMATLGSVLTGYGLPASVVDGKPSKYRTPYVAAGWRWAGSPNEEPGSVVSFQDSNQQVLFAAFWPITAGTEIGVFPVGEGDQRLSALPIIGHWKQQDPSLSSIGVIPTDQVLITPPHVRDEYFVEIVEASGYPLTLDNLAAVGGTIARMFLGKAFELIVTKDRRVADQFVQNHSYEITSFNEYSHSQRVLDDLGRWDPVVLFYIQDLPMRVRALALEVIETSGSIGDITLER
jgi:hypothetical protein